MLLILFLDQYQQPVVELWTRDPKTFSHALIPFRRREQEELGGAGGRRKPRKILWDFLLHLSKVESTVQPYEPISG
ncbi:hypothetical protein AMECASPLE_019374 [Ameca splendens]|uniref:Uncharacterized protein n=1 Tax=Ameca splendens TaxID=208324 RepID=A0ABV0ZNA5_9TELE